MGKQDLVLVRPLQVGDSGPDVVAIRRMTSRAGVNYPPQVRVNGRFDDQFEDKLKAAITRFQRKRGLKPDGAVAYMTFKALLPFADAYDTKLLTGVARASIGDWGIMGRKSAFNGIDMGVDFSGKGSIPMFADGKIVRIQRTKSGWPGEGGLIVVECDKGPMAKHPIYVAEDISIPASHAVGKRLRQGELLAEATGSNQAPGIEMGWAGPAPGYISTLWFSRNQKHYTHNYNPTAEGTDFWKTLSAWMAKGIPV